MIKEDDEEDENSVEPNNRFEKIVIKIHITCI